MSERAIALFEDVDAIGGPGRLLADGPERTERYTAAARDFEERIELNGSALAMQILGKMLRNRAEGFSHDIDRCHVSMEQAQEALVLKNSVATSDFASKHMVDLGIAAWLFVTHDNPVESTGLMSWCQSRDGFGC